jgi:DNA-binding PadR family transcriptional regulator
MSIRNGLLALLERKPMYGYQLRVAFEQSVGGTWSLNIGQVYTTLSRLERDEFVLALPENDEGQRPYEITEAGRAELTRWFTTPVERSDRPRDELAIKLALAMTTPGVDVAAVVQAQRTAGVRALQEYTRLKVRRDSRDQGDMSWSLVLEAMIFQCEAEIRWLDYCEAVVLRQRPAHKAGSAGGTATAGETATAAEKRAEATA